MLTVAVDSSPDIPAKSWGDREGNRGLSPAANDFDTTQVIGRQPRSAHQASSTTTRKILLRLLIQSRPRRRCE